MKSLLFIITTVVLITGCDNTHQKHETHSHTDSSGSHHSMDSATTTPMQQLMNNMMDAMHAQKSTGNNDVDFAQMMLAHHQGAVKMAELQIDKGSSEPLKEFSRNIVKAQMAEIDSFQRILSVTSPVLSENPSQFQQEMQKSMQPMMQHDMKAETDLDTEFVNLMIPHHQGAVDMAKVYQKFGTNIGLRKISQSIIQSQNKEIDWMHEWLKNKK